MRKIIPILIILLLFAVNSYAEKATTYNSICNESIIITPNPCMNIDGALKYYAWKVKVSGKIKTAEGACLEVFIIKYLGEISDTPYSVQERYAKLDSSVSQSALAELYNTYLSEDITQ